MVFPSRPALAGMSQLALALTSDFSEPGPGNRAEWAFPRCWAPRPGSSIALVAVSAHFLGGWVQR